VDLSKNTTFLDHSKRLFFCYSKRLRNVTKWPTTFGNIFFLCVRVTSAV